MRACIAALWLATAVACPARDARPDGDVAAGPAVDPTPAYWPEADAIVDALEIAPDAFVVQFGARSGHLSRALAEHLKRGLVLALDVDPRWVDHLRDQAEVNGLANLNAWPTLEERPELTALARKPDMAVVTELLARLDDAPAWFAALRPQLAEGARVVILDSRPGIEAATVRDLFTAGYELVSRGDPGRGVLLVFAPSR